jgi:hypothetical protein
MPQKCAACGSRLRRSEEHVAGFPARWRFCEPCGTQGPTDNDVRATDTHEINDEIREAMRASLEE